MASMIIRRDAYLRAAQLFHWATRDHYVEWFTGEVKRHRRTEVMLPRLVKQGKLRVKKYGKKYVYSAPRRVKGMKKPLIYHGLGCTEGLIRMAWSNRDCTIIPERMFKGMGNVPEWGIRYNHGKLLLYEFSTRSNFELGVVMNKVKRYQATLPSIEGRFKGEALVLFVVDVERDRLQTYIEKKHPDGPYFFVDYETFTSVPLGKQLDAKIYLWGEDGQPYSLKNDGLEGH